MTRLKLKDTLRRANTLYAMPWFFKVSAGWAPYSSQQSEQLEIGFQRFQAGHKEHVVLDQWRIDLEKMKLDMEASPSIPIRT